MCSMSKDEDPSIFRHLSTDLLYSAMMLDHVATVSGGRMNVSRLKQMPHRPRSSISTQLKALMTQ